METIIIDLEKSLKDQLTSLADQIKLAEDSLMRDKELYLKVTGALEGISILQQRLNEEVQEDESSVNVALG